MTRTLRGGFTLVEGVLVLLLVGILAAVGVPRFFSKRGFDADFYYDDVLSALRYAQRLAVASGCPVEVRFTGPDYALAQRSGCRVGVFSQAVPHPGTGAATYAGQAPAGTLLVAPTNPIVFDGLGRALDASASVTDVTLTIDARPLLLAGETGFAHDPAS